MAPDGSVPDHFPVNHGYLNQNLPDLTANGRSFLATWNDERREPVRIYFTLITPGGHVLDDSGIPLSGPDTSRRHMLPAPASNGDQYFAAWLAGRVPGYDVLGARVSATGAILDSVPVTIGTDTLVLERPAAAADGRNYLIAWSGQSPRGHGSVLYFRRLDDRGKLLDSVPTVIAENPEGLTDPAVAFNGSCYLLVWSGTGADPDIYGCRVRPDGTVLDPQGFPICPDSGDQLYPAVATDGDRFLVTWADRGGGDFDIAAAFVDGSGQVGLAERIGQPNRRQVRLEVAPNPVIDRATIAFGLPLVSRVSLGIYDAGGRLVNQLRSGVMPAGEYRAVWDGCDALGRDVPVGAYFCRLASAFGGSTRQIVRTGSKEQQ